MLKYQLLDYWYLFFHTVLMLFNVLGWIFKKTRKWNLLTLSLTAFSWFALGYYYGWGYCVLTDWHWDVLFELGAYPSENSYVQYLFRRLLHLKISAQLADGITVLFFLLSIIMSVILNIIDYKKRKINKKPQ